MFEQRQDNNGTAGLFRTGRMPGQGGRLQGVVCGAVLLALAASTSAQTFRLGPLDMTALGNVDFAYDSNVDEAAEDEVKEGYSRDDFYWMPSLSIASAPVPMRPSTMLGVEAAVAYQDYFARSDLDTETYNVSMSFQTTHPRLTLDGNASADYSIENEEHAYVPGGFSRDPMLTQMADIGANWNYRRLRLEGSSAFTRERHDYLEYQPDDQDESVLFAGAYLDNIYRLNLFSTLQQTDTTYIQADSEEEETVTSLGVEWPVFSWGGLFYTWEKTVTEFSPEGEETEETEGTLGINGSIPIDWIRHPKITYSIGIEHEQTTTVDGEETDEWKPVHTLNVSDEYQLTKTVQISGSATWDNDVAEDEVEFVYNLRLAQLIGARAQHALIFTQEPKPTFGSNSDTESTTYGYNFEVRDLVFYNLTMNLGVTYEEETPLGEVNALTEKTTSYNWGLNHTRKISRQLDRILSYQYSWEKSDFDKTGATIRHLVIYGFSYAF